MPTLRPYQLKLEADVEASWTRGHRVVLAISPTGSGKTVTFSRVLQREPGASAAIVHRKELVGQISMALARNGVRHRVIAPDTVCREIVAMHMFELKRSYYDPNARCGVVGIDSMLTMDPRDPWLRQVQLFIGDEGHHFLRDNKWGRGVAMLPNARGALFTATGFRADGNGLGRGVLLPSGKWSNDGLADDIVLGPTARELIDDGYLTGYRVIAPPTDIDYADVPVTATGDLSPAKLRAKVHKSTRIVGDVIASYKEFALGKLAIAFGVDVEAAEDLALAFRKASVAAEMISAKTPPLLRQQLLAKFRRREVHVLVNVDLFGEGFDVPALECVIMVRKTESTGLFDQMFGRMLRVMVGADLMDQWEEFTPAQRHRLIAESNKPRGILIDHVGNFVRHLPPDSTRIHSLERRERRSRGLPQDAIPLRQCVTVGCFNVYPRTMPCCPYCKVKPVPESRGEPAHVDGDLLELDETALEALRGYARKVWAAPSFPAGADFKIVQGIKNRHHEHVQAVKELTAAIDLWCGYQTHLGRDLSEQYKRFYFAFGVDVLSALAMNRADAMNLRAIIEQKLAIDGVVRAA